MFEIRKNKEREFHRTNDGIVSRPLKNLEELLHWNSESVLNQNSTKLIIPKIK